MKAVGAGLFALLLGTNALAQPDGAITATGSFGSLDVKFEVQSAIAYIGQSAQDRSEQVITVVISNAWMDPDGIADFFDRHRAVERLIKDEETVVVYLEFTREGAYRGISYAFAQGNRCNFCATDAASTVALQNGRLVGGIEGIEELRPFEVKIDVPIMNDDHGAPLPADGGPPATAYLAYHSAIVNKDPGALRPTLSIRRLEVWNRASMAGLLDEYVNYLASEHPTKDLQIARGWASESKATLIVEGMSESGPVGGEVLLLNENGIWHVEQEVIE
jgi:hypothetical protein